ncbi:MAG: hypothetical protein BYD32DRAFT_402906 [Podila humilis]|nr:MAG: hypothetical protein BYD32DRAFT_402906 [Podila humilis]
MSDSLISSSWLSTDATLAHPQSISPSHSKSITLDPSVRHTSPICIPSSSSLPPSSPRIRTSRIQDVSCSRDKHKASSQLYLSHSLAKITSGKSGASFASTSKTKIRSNATSAPVIVQYPDEKSSESAAQKYARTVRTQWRSTDLARPELVSRTNTLRVSAFADPMRLSSLPKHCQKSPRSSSVHLLEHTYQTKDSTIRKSTKAPKERKRSCSPPRRRHVYTSFPIQQHLYSLDPPYDNNGSSEEEERGICREPCCTSPSFYDRNVMSSNFDTETPSSSTRKSARKMVRRKRTQSIYKTGNHHAKPHLESINLDGLVRTLERMDMHGCPYLTPCSTSKRDMGCYSCEEEEDLEEVEMMSFIITVTPTEARRDVLSRPPRVPPPPRPHSYASSI